MKDFQKAYIYKEVVAKTGRKAGGLAEYRPQ
jgi:hypothetical protein